MKKINIEEVNKEFMDSLREEDSNLVALHDIGLLSEYDVLHELGYEVAGIVKDYSSSVAVGDRVRVTEKAYPYFQKEYSKFGYELPHGVTGTIVHQEVGLSAIEWDNKPYFDPTFARNLMFFPWDLEIVEKCSLTLEVVKTVTVTTPGSDTRYEVEIATAENGSVRFSADKIVKEAIHRYWKRSFFTNPMEASSAISAYLI